MHNNQFITNILFKQSAYCVFLSIVILLET